MNAAAPALTLVEQPTQPTREEITRTLEEANRANRALMLQSFEIAFESILEHISNGQPLEQFVREYHTKLPVASLRAWIYRDPKRKNAYLVAKAIGAEAIEDELIRISDGVKADGSASLDDVARSKLRIDTRFRLLQVWNRKRYGDVKQVNTTSTTTLDVANMTSEEINRRILESMGVVLDPNSSGSAIFDDPTESLDEFA